MLQEQIISQVSQEVDKQMEARFEFLEERLETLRSHIQRDA